MSQALNAQALEYIEVTGEALEAAQKMASEHLARQQKVASYIPTQVDALVKSKLIETHEKKAAFDKLATHEGALEVIGNLARYILKQAAEQSQAAQVQGQGAPISQKTASDRTANDNYVGRRFGEGEEPASWRNFEAALGLG